MALGAGAYDDLVTYVREKVDADGVMVLVVGGNRGNGFAQQWVAPTDATFIEQLRVAARALRSVADQMERDADAYASRPVGEPS